MSDGVIWVSRLPEFQKLMEMNQARANAAVQPDMEMVHQFFGALYPRVNEGFVNFRAIPERDKGAAPQNVHYALDHAFFENVEGFVRRCAETGKAAFFVPATMRPGGTGKVDVLSMPAILADFDSGDPAESLRAAEALLGPATVILESGGLTDDRKLPRVHAHWRLSHPAVGADIESVCRVRELLAEKFGGDRSFKQSAQPIRIGGSLHQKAGAKLVRIRTVRDDAEYALDDICRAVGMTEAPTSNVVPFSMDFSRDKPASNDVERVLTAPIRAGALDEFTRFEGVGKALGHYIRNMRDPATRWTEEQAWEAAQGYNQAMLNPPWDEQRLRGDFNRLLAEDLRNHGPVVQVEPVVATSATRRPLADWNIKFFAGAAPERKWLVDGLIPAGTAGVFAAVGDAGKSMMALKLAYIIGCYATPAGDPTFDFDIPHFFGQPITARGVTVVLTAEDDATEVHRRIAALDASNLRAGNPRMFVRPMISDGGPRAIIEDGPAGPQPTEFWRELRDELRCMPNLRLVVLDPLSHFAAVNLDNDNRAAAALMAMLGALAAETGAAVMLVHHMSKSAVPTSLTDARTAIRGASALVDNGRWALAMWEQEEDKARHVLKLLGQQSRAGAAGVVYSGGLTKGNAPGAKTIRTLVRNVTSGLLEDVTDQLSAVARPQQAELDQRAVDALRAEAQDNSRFQFTSGEGALWATWQPVFIRAGVRITKREVVALFERLYARKEIAMTEQKRGSHPVYVMNLD